MLFWKTTRGGPILINKKKLAEKHAYLVSLNLNHTFCNQAVKCPMTTQIKSHTAKQELNSTAILNTFTVNRKELLHSASTNYTKIMIYYVFSVFPKVVWLWHSPAFQINILEVIRSLKNILKYRKQHLKALRKRKRYTSLISFSTMT